MCRTVILLFSFVLHARGCASVQCFFGDKSDRNDDHCAVFYAPKVPALLSNGMMSSQPEVTRRYTEHAYAEANGTTSLSSDYEPRCADILRMKSTGETSGGKWSVARGLSNYRCVPSAFDATVHSYGVKCCSRGEQRAVHYPASAMADFARQVAMPAVAALPLTRCHWSGPNAPLGQAAFCPSYVGDLCYTMYYLSDNGTAEVTLRGCLHYHAGDLAALVHSDTGDIVAVANASAMHGDGDAGAAAGQPVQLCKYLPASRAALCVCNKHYCNGGTVNNVAERFFWTSVSTRFRIHAISAAASNLIVLSRSLSACVVICAVGKLL